MLFVMVCFFTLKKHILNGDRNSKECLISNNWLLLMILHIATTFFLAL